jgi:hypothetical protein
MEIYKTTLGGFFMAKSPHSAEWKLKVIEEYLSGQGSYISLAKMYGIGTTTLRSWVSSNRRSLPKVWKPLISGHLRPVIHLFVTSILPSPHAPLEETYQLDVLNIYS